MTSRVGQYRILATLGEGGMGTVFHGEHVLLGRRAAIKTLRRELASRREVVDRFFNEARATSAIADPGVVQIYDFGFHVDGTAYIVMELLDGESLADRIARGGPLPADAALKLLRQVASSVGAAHARGIVHRDLKPEHVIIICDPEAESGERTKILDFGICKHERGDGMVVTQDGELLGTPVFISPEQCRGARDIDHRADIYSLGCVLFDMLTGRPPFTCESSVEYVAAHLREAPPAPSQFASGIPPEVDALVARCLAKAPRDRFASCRALIDAIAEASLAMRIDDAIAEPDDSDDVLDAWVKSVEPTPAPRLAFTPDPSTLRAASGELGVVRVRRRSRFGTLLALVVVGATIAGFVVLIIAPSPSNDAPVAASPRELEPEPEPELEPEPEPEASPVAEPPPPPPKVEEPPPPPRTVDRPRPMKRRTAVRYRVPAPEPSPPAITTSVEDLYDTR